MPLSQCTPSIPGSNQTAQTIVKYAYTEKNILSFEMLAIVAAFIWPLILLFITQLFSTINGKLTFKLFEIFLCCGSAYALVALMFFGELLYGGYIASIAVAFYLLIVTYELYLIVKLLLAKKRHRVTEGI